MIQRIFTTTLFLIFSLLYVQAQLIPVPLEADELEVRVTFDKDSEEQDIYQTNFIQSTIDEDMSITWEKIIDYSGNRNWGYQVCDKNLCYLSHVFTKDFDMEPLERGELTVHLERNGVFGDSGVVYVKLYRNDIDNSDSLFMKAVFIEETRVSTMKAVSRTDVEIFPNPAVNYINIKSPSNIGEVVIFDILGRQMLKENLAGRHGGTISVESLREGTYFISIHDTNGDRIKTSRLIKQTSGS